MELTRLGGNLVSSKTFDLVVRTRSGQEHQFRWGAGEGGALLRAAAAAQWRVRGCLGLGATQTPAHTRHSPPLCRSIQRSEWQVLLDFFQAKKLRVERLKEAQAGPGVAAARAAAAAEFGDDDDDAAGGWARCCTAALLQPSARPCQRWQPPRPRA